MRIRLELEASEELSAATAYLDAQSPGLGDEFVAAFSVAGKQLLDFPLSGQKIGRGTRRVLIRRFPYQLIYRVEGDEIIIYAVARQKRRPGYWRKRL